MRQSSNQASKQVSKCFYHRGTRENDRVHGVGKYWRFAQVCQPWREAHKYFLCVLDRSPLFLCDKNTYFLRFLPVIPYSDKIVRLGLIEIPPASILSPL